MANAARRYPLFVNEFFMKRAKSFMGTVVEKALGIEHYWDRVEFAPGRGGIHLHIIGIVRDKAYLRDFYTASTNKEKADVLEKYARETLDMTADSLAVIRATLHLPVAVQVQLLPVILATTQV